MKKVYVTVVVVVVFGGVVYAQSFRPRIEGVEGTVEIKAPGSGVWEAAVVGQELDEEALVSTGFKSGALIRIGESTLRVRALTRLSLGELAAAGTEDRVEIRLQAGRIRAEVRPPGAGRGIAFEVRSPTATASVRGTVFEFDTVNLRVEEGRVAFAGADRTWVYVGDGESSFPDPVTGKAAAAVETAAVQAAPLPAGAGESVSLPGTPAVSAVPALPGVPAVPVVPGPAVPDPVVPGPAVPGPVNVGIRWPE